MNTQRVLAFRSAVVIAILFIVPWTSGAQATAPEPPAAVEASSPASDTPDGQEPAAGPATPEPPAGAATPDPAQATTDAPAQDGFRVGAFTFKPSGRIKLDVIRDFNPIGSEDSFDTRTIAIDGSDGTNSNIHAKETRLNLDIRGMVEGRELRMFVETDFYGTSSALRLRHAYGSWGGLLAGQTWSTFMDDDNMPRTIDFESPTAFAQIRQAQVRWTQKVGSAFTWNAALEDNKSAVTIPTGIPGEAEYPMPDLVGRARYDFPRGHVTASGFVGAASFRPTDDDPDSVALWGTMGSVKVTTFKRDYGYAIFTFGDGIGRYRGGTTAVPDERGVLHAVGGAAFMGGYEHFWAERWSTNGVYSVADTSDEPFYTSAINKQLHYGAVNLIYSFLGDRAWTGVEYLYGHREVFGDGDDSGSAHRLQYAVRFNLP